MIASKTPSLVGRFPQSDEIEREQMRLMRDLVEYARENSPFYRKQLKGVNTDMLQRRDDLRMLPFTRSHDIREHGPEMICVSDDDIARIITINSSGTTGKPKRLHFTENDINLTLEFFRHGMTTMVRPGERVVILLPGDTPDSTGDILMRALAAEGIDGVAYGLAPDPFATINILAREKPECIVGFPIQLLAAARADFEGRIPRADIKSVLLCSDYIPETVIQELELAWDCEIFSHYGTVETGLGGGVECGSHEGIHIREDDLLFETVHPRTGNPVPTGVEGEITVTTLTRRGMPLIRYRTGDIAALHEETCPCGSNLRRLGKIKGRIDNRCILASGASLAMSTLDERIFAIPGVADFNAEMHSINGGETLSLEVSVVKGFENECDGRIREALTGLGIFSSTALGIRCSPVTKVSPAKRMIHDKRKDR